MPEIAPQHGITATFSGKDYPLKIRHAEIERWEQQHHRGILHYVWGSFEMDGKVATSRENKDFLILGLIGAGMKEKKAVRLIDGLPTQSYIDEIVLTCRELVLATFYMPELVGDEESETAGGEAGNENEKKNTALHQ